MYNNMMRNVGMFDRSNILGYNRRVLAPFSHGNILGMNTAFTHDTGGIISTAAGLGVGLGAQALASSLNGQPNNTPFNQPFNQQFNQPFNQPNIQTAPPQNSFNNATPTVGSPMNNVQSAYGVNNNTAQQTNYNPPPAPQYIPPSPTTPTPVQHDPAPAPTPTITYKPTPSLVNKVSKGSKTNICPAENAPQIKACLGWHTICCDVDVSAFMLDANSKSLGDEWFVFYGQPQSPDGALRLNSTESQDMQSMVVNFAKLNPNVKRIVFVLTINEALQKNQNFSMVSDAYIRIMDVARNVELVSFPITEYYSTITSMMVGEIYFHNGNWKFNAIGNGVARDLAGLCEFYGIETI